MIYIGRKYLDVLMGFRSEKRWGKAEGRDDKTQSMQSRTSHDEL